METMHLKHETAQIAGRQPSVNHPIVKFHHPTWHDLRILYTTALFSYEGQSEQ